MALRRFPIVYIVLVISYVHGKGVQDSICARMPELQVLQAKSIHDFNCVHNDTARSLNCSGQGIPSLPSTTDTNVTEGTEIFDFSNNMIKCLPKINNTRPTCSVKDCQAGCLLELHLQHNEIEFLHDEVFVDLTCLNILDLSDNAITNETIHFHHFFRLNLLQHLNLHGNPLHTLPDNVINAAFLTHLRTLNLSSCQLERISEIAMDDLFNLEDLDLSDNKLSTLSGKTFQGLVSLRILDLRWNRLQVIEKDTFADMKQLQELLLDHNRLTSISEYVFNSRVGLESLGLFKNSFSAIPVHALSGLTKLRWLDMSYNPIQALTPGHVNTTVQELRLEYLDSLTEVKDHAFSAFPLLTALSLHHCGRLSVLSSEAFRGSSSHLRHVLLDHNGLHELSEDLLPWGQLSLLTLHANPWVCDCSLGWTAGRPLGNTSLSCAGPLKLRGQMVHLLTESELSCPVSILGMQVVTGLSLTLVVLVIIGLALWHKQRRMFCWCLCGDKGQYVTIFTKDKAGHDDDLVNGSCGDGEVDDLDLGNGEEGGGSESGRVTIMMKTLSNGYRRLKGQGGGESSLDLTSACDV